MPSHSVKDIQMRLEYCLICREQSLENIPEYSSLGRVTSDCKPWPKGGQLTVCQSCGTIQKIPDNQWFEEIQKIYRSYEIYHLSNGEEQRIFFPDGQSFPRSQVLVDFLVKKNRLDLQPGELIDIGCGNGSAIGNFSKTLHNWVIDGNELSDKALPILRTIPGFRKLYVGHLSEISNHYDLVSLIHSLEHMSNPIETLTYAKKLLLKNGILFIEVPDVETSPFDLLVADHLCHFSRSTISYLAHQIGIELDFLENTLLPKEITFIGHLEKTSSKKKELTPNPLEGISIAKRTVSWLHSLLDSGIKTSQENNFGIFGTSISGTWLYGSLRDRVKFFVDEDTSRIGGAFDGKPILAPEKIPVDARILLPFVPSVSENIIRRHPKIKTNLIPPPPFDQK